MVARRRPVDIVLRPVAGRTALAAMALVARKKKPRIQSNEHPK